MDRENAIKVMTKTVNDMNRHIGQLNHVPEEDLNKVLEEHEEYLNHVNGKIYDALKLNGVIN